MPVGIKIENCKDIKIIDCGFSGLQIGIDVSDSNEVNISGASFLNVNTGVRAKRVRGLKASNCTDDDSYTSTSFRLSAAAKIVRWYTEYLRGRG
ncbi:hypothetical protein [Shewanella sp. Isolate11]|uniref:hypothetical protein n=1 Tax=Shewanella sp. Isolate11 TaxID=2908530 RepID=UPI001EFD8DAA|nr:hypothetical protein [Shewanella sp. Isolate11]MCG9697542.1 hypothetical protein [Shewanella sp. Isolate11]